MTLLGLALSVILAAPTEPATKRNPTMEIDRKDQQKAVEGPAEYFTGKATIRGQFARGDGSRVTGAFVTFEAGARTNWHSHPLGQTLIVVDGVGWTQVEGGQKVEFAEGDIMWCPKDKRHWHGATPHGPMTHVAIQESMDGKNVTWMEPVDDATYLGDVGE